MVTRTGHRIADVVWPVQERVELSLSRTLTLYLYWYGSEVSWHFWQLKYRANSCIICSLSGCQVLFITILAKPGIGYHIPPHLFLFSVFLSRCKNLPFLITEERIDGIALNIQVCWDPFESWAYLPLPALCYLEFDEQMEIWKNTGPKTEHWGTSMYTLHVYVDALRITCWIQLFNQL